MSDWQVAFLAKVERIYGRAYVVAPGPLRDRLLVDAGDDAIAVATDRPYVQPIAWAVEPDGTVVQVQGAVL